MSSSTELNVARKKLVDALGDKAKVYFQQMKMWFQMKCSKQEFDLESRKMMTVEQIHLHNEFLLCLFGKCQSLSSSSSSSSRNKSSSPGTKSSMSRDRAKKAKLKRRNRSDKGGFERADVRDYLPTLSSPPPQAYEEPLRYSYQELFLPDSSLVFGRVMLAAWERDLEGAEDAVADYIVAAVQHFLRNVITAVLIRKSGYRLREYRFIHAMGGVVPNPWLRSTIRALDFNAKAWSVEEDESEGEGQEEPVKKPTLDDIEQKAAFEIACGCETVKTPVTVYHILEALQVNRNIIPPNNVYSVFMQKVINSLSHPSYEELEVAS